MFIVLAGPASRLAVAEQRYGLARPSLTRVAEGAGWIALMRAGQSALVLADGQGVVFGDLFSRANRWARLTGAKTNLASSIAIADPAALALDYWGRYVGLLIGGDGGLSICRDPSGGLGCFHTHVDGVEVFFSDLELMIELGLVRREIDWTGLAHHLSSNGQRLERTGLVGISEILPGDYVAVGKSAPKARAYWRPSAFIGRELQIRDAREAAQSLFTTIEGVIGALASVQGQLVVELSGGLDSSIVAMALRRRSRITAINITTTGAEGDERVYARAVAERAGLPLLEFAVSASDIDFRRPPVVRAPRPGRSTVLQPVDAIFMREGQRLGSSAFFNGTGGDSVLGYLTSAAPAVDRLWAEGLGGGVVETLLDIASLTGSTVWDVARIALKIGLRPRRGPRASPRPRLLSTEFQALQRRSHPWAEGLDTAPPGRRRHIEAILGVHGHLDGLDRNRVAPVVAPHAAQPILELMLRIPTWMNVAGGRDRAVARAAYASLLPAEVYNRRSKGRINGFIVEAYQANRAIIGEMLREGRMAKAGLLDLDAVAFALAEPVETDEARFMGLVRLVDAELWAQGLLG